MITRQRTITQQFSQQKSLRSTSLKTKTTVSSTVVTDAPTSKRLKRACRIDDATVTTKKTKINTAIGGNPSIKECFKKALSKSPTVPTQDNGPEKEMHPSPLTANVLLQSANNEGPKSSDYPKYRKAEDLIKRNSLLKERDNTIARDASPSPSVAHKTKVFNENLKLPVTYDTLLSQFTAGDRCIAMMDNRSETVTFSKLKSSVEAATKRTLTEQTLGQMLHVFPGCYKLEYTQTLFNSSNLELTIRADCNAGIDKEDIHMSPQRHLTVNLMRKRETIFKQNLLKLVADSHSDYIKSLGISVLLDTTALRRWHPNFPLETATPVITCAQLPQRPGGGTPRHWTAKEILERYAKKTPHLAKFIESKENDVPKATAPIAAPSTPKSFKIIKSGPFAGLREDLVAKVREREQRDKDLSATVDPVADLNRIRRGRLPQLIRIIRGLFFRQTKSVSLNDLLSTVHYSWTSPISEDEVRATFDLLVETFPKWIRVLTVSISPDPLVQIEASTDINSLITSLRSNDVTKV